MGKHFDQLIEFVRHNLRKDEKIRAPGHIDNVQGYLEKLIRRTKLFDMPFDVRDIYKKPKEEARQNEESLINFLELSEEKGKFALTPFPITGIEDLISVVILDEISFGNYIATLAFYNPPDRERNFHSTTVTIAHVGLDRNNLSVTLNPEVIFIGGIRSGIRVPEEELDRKVRGDNDEQSFGGKTPMMDGVVSSAMVYLDQIAYIMHPDTYIVQRENTDVYRKRGKKQKKIRNRKLSLAKTVNRPHFLIKTYKEVREFFNSEAKNGNDAYPVRNHNRTYSHPRYVNVRGKTVEISQHWKGDGILQGKYGWWYEVWMKMTSVKIVPYTEYHQIQEEKKNSSRRRPSA